MNIDKIIKRHQQLDHELMTALSTMEKKETIIELREKIKENQEQCPHFSTKYNWVPKDEKCPYCGAKL